MQDSSLSLASPMLLTESFCDLENTGVGQRTKRLKLNPEMRGALNVCDDVGLVLLRRI